MSWDQIQVYKSSDENVSKFVFTKGDAIAESVLYKYPDYKTRTVICCSTQSGCPVGCRFCGAGDKFIRSLTTEEIISQPIHLLGKTGLDPRDIEKIQIMFMSMGEPLLNPGAMMKALRILYMLYPKARLLISTSAPDVDYEPWHQISEEIETIGLQFSIHESTDEARNQLIPLKAKLTLHEIACEGELWYKRTGRRPFFNYCVHPGNNTIEDAQRLYNLFNPSIWESTLSVVCERDESIAASNARQLKLVQDFATIMMRDAGYSVRVFNPAGQDDIGGGCGQLWFVQDWMKDKKAAATAGTGKPIVHAVK